MQSNFTKLFSNVSWIVATAAFAATLTSFVWFQSEKSSIANSRMMEEVAKAIEYNIKPIEDFGKQIDLLKSQISELEERVDFYKEKSNFLEMRIQRLEQQ